MTNYNYLKEGEDKKDEVSCETPITYESVKTVRGVYKDLKHSPFEITVNGKVLKFSSETKKRKFETEMNIKELQLENAFNRVHGGNFDKEKTNFNGLINVMKISNYNKLKLK